MLLILGRRIDFVLGERLAAAAIAARHAPSAPRAATPGFIVAGDGPDPASWGQVARTLPRVDLHDAYSSETPVRFAAPAVPRGQGAQDVHFR
eukprot:16162408-Heterocapsa_arctica.AAC.1